MVSLLFQAFLLLSPAATQAADKPAFRICYFSLNNEKEFQEMDKFTKNLNKYSQRKIEVKEFLTEEEAPPEEAFRAMVKSGTRCDGLVISGHHTGSWGGKRASGSLNLNFLEEISCEKEFQKWFQKVNALWLQGCRTLGVGTIQPSDTGLDMFSADAHTLRVGEVLEEDALEQGFSDLNMEFSATLDQGNPLSSRYLRLFPHAKVFGWTKTAPGENAQSQLSIPYHMAHIASLLDKEGKYPEDPTSGKLAEKSVAKYLDAMYLALSNLEVSARSCEELTVDAWKHHGQAYGVEPYSFGNPDLNAFTKLDSSADGVLLGIKKKECALKTAKSDQEVLQAIREMTKDPTQLGYMFNSIWEKLRTAESEELREKIKAELRSNKALIAFIHDKLQSAQVGLLPKLDLYAFYREVNNRDEGDIENLIFEAAKKQLNALAKEGDYALIDYQQTILQSLVKNELFPYDRVGELDNPNIIPTIVDSIAGSTHLPERGLDKLFVKVMELPPEKQRGLLRNLTESTLGTADDKTKPELMEEMKANPRIVELLKKGLAKENNDASSLAEFYFLQRELYGKRDPALEERIFQIAKQQLESPDALDSDEQETLISFLTTTGSLTYERGTEIKNARVLTTLTYRIRDSVSPVSGAAAILDKVMQNPAGDSGTLTAVAQAAASEQFPAAETERLLQELTALPRSDSRVLEWVARSLNDPETPLPHADDIFMQVLHSPKCNAKCIGGLLETFRYDRNKTPYPSAPNAFREMLKSKYKDPFVTDSIALAVPMLDNPEDVRQLRNQLLQEKIFSTGLRGLAESVTQSKKSFPDDTETLWKILRSPHWSYPRDVGIMLAPVVLCASNPIPQQKEIALEALRMMEKAEPITGSMVYSFDVCPRPHPYVLDIMERTLKAADNDQQVFRLNQFVETHKGSLKFSENFLKLLEEKKSRIGMEDPETVPWDD